MRVTAGAGIPVSRTVTLGPWIIASLEVGR